MRGDGVGRETRRVWGSSKDGSDRRMRGRLYSGGIVSKGSLYWGGEGRLERVVGPTKEVP